MWMWVTAAAFLAGLAIRSRYERSIFVSDVYELGSKKLKKDRTFVFLSDLHDNQFGRNQRWLLAAIEKAEPDGILIGGDMMVVKKRADVQAALFFVKQLARRYPVYYGNGNHENRMDRRRDRYGDAYDRYVEELKAAGVRYLADESAELDQDIRISGLDLDKRHYGKFIPRKMEEKYILHRLGRASSERYQILLAHSPGFFRTYAAWGADLTLSGHYHGGTVRLPFLGGLMTPQFEFFRKCCGGLLKDGEKAMVVSRGLGTHSINLRLNNPSQLVILKLRAE